MCSVYSEDGCDDSICWMTMMKSVMMVNHLDNKEKNTIL